MLFTEFKLNKSLLNALNTMSISEATAIQTKVFSPIMSGKDIVGIAQTGTGKTLAYLLPSFQLWEFTKSPHPQILVIVPTRELVQQLVHVATELTEFMNVAIVGVYGGTNIKTQKAAIIGGADIVIGTPGRLVDLFKDGVLKTKLLKRLIIDEVDEMLNLGFRTQLRIIHEFIPERCQHLMFSATMTEDVEKVIREFTDYYTKIETAPSGAPLEHIEQLGYSIQNFNSKANLLERLLSDDTAMTKVLVFAKTKKMADALFERMESVFTEKIGIIHSSKSQNNRFDTVAKFEDGTVRCLIATDIIARGLDVTTVTHVINFDLTDTPEKYIHRIGRTGRSEQKGISISFVSDEDREYLEEIEALMNKQITILDLPIDLELSEELIALEKPSEYVPFNPHKIKKRVPSGPAFHEKKEKNKKVNNKIRKKEKMKLKYGKPIKKRRKAKK